MNYPQLWRTSGIALSILSAALAIPSVQAAGHTVRSGDTFTSIAKKYKIPLATLQKANPKVKPGVIVSGQVINLPASVAPKTALAASPKATAKESKASKPVVAKTKTSPAGKSTKSAPEVADPPRLAATKPAKRPAGSSITTYQVRAGDTATSLAKRSKISVGELAEMNGLEHLDLHEGQKLVLPAGTTPAAATPSDHENTVDLTPPPRRPNANESPSRRPAPSVNPPAASGTYYHVVKRGETFSSIARDKSVSLTALTKANQSVNPARLSVGQQLNVPGVQVASRQSNESLIDPAPASRSTAYRFDPAGDQEATDAESSDQPAPSIAYRITARDTVETLSREFNTTPAELRQLNQKGTFDEFTPGSFIQVPWQNPARRD